MPETRFGWHRRAAVADVFVRSDDHRHLRGKPHPLAQSRFRRCVRNFRVEGGERRHRRAQHVHRVRALHRADDVVHRRRQHARRLQLGLEGLELGPLGQFPLEEQVAGLLEGRALGEVVNRIAAVEQLAPSPLDEADARAIEVHPLEPAMDFDLFGVFIRHRVLLSARRASGAAPCPRGPWAARRRSGAGAASCTVRVASDNARAIPLRRNMPPV